MASYTATGTIDTPYAFLKRELEMEKMRQEFARVKNDWNDPNFYNKGKSGGGGGGVVPGTNMTREEYDNANRDFYADAQKAQELRISEKRQDEQAAKNLRSQELNERMEAAHTAWLRKRDVEKADATQAFDNRDAAPKAQAETLLSQTLEQEKTKKKMGSPATMTMAAAAA